MIGDSTGDYSKLIGTGAEEAGKAIHKMEERKHRKEILKEKKRRRLADMLSKALKRDTELYRLSTESGDEATNNRVNAIQDVARSFAESYKR
jgi:hypothetical protein